MPICVSVRVVWLKISLSNLGSLDRVYEPWPPPDLGGKAAAGQGDGDGAGEYGCSRGSRRLELSGVALLKIGSLLIANPVSRVSYGNPPGLARRGLLAGLARRGLASVRKSINAESTGPRTMYDKIWDDHIVEGTSDGTALLYS
ncbi:hypothetical protein EMIHUDRAFT_259023 [Emiliania huxleyi CCMP1516]|uniref:Uncharacterized protein n=2 Tax=Emiliania huxleyi TaxID=2903 RepID=A0A0D3I4P6_EMIH1|nr:hypothetical protein EMIHUDRAFT_259023 [Emiliania huxleyi CCMP1516]EOD06231.1 hypothetical protein EMIHUDRAFT_259023 [Emiliania huxleyi CCMP1516]|eukprot:XP_005758660.1 hypothetical protein EMIHUDRAFT_259023 [Emiliania huxleyi CCMP1516]